MRQKQSAETFA